MIDIVLLYHTVEYNVKKKISCSNWTFVSVHKRTHPANTPNKLNNIKKARDATIFYGTFGSTTNASRLRVNMWTWVIMSKWNKRHRMHYRVFCACTAYELHDIPNGHAHVDYHCPVIVGTVATRRSCRFRDTEKMQIKIEKGEMFVETVLEVDTMIHCYLSSCHWTAQARRSAGAPIRFIVNVVCA